MIPPRIFLVILIILQFSIQTYCVNEKKAEDSLRLAYISATAPEVKCRILLELSNEAGNTDVDEAIQYAEASYNLALKTTNDTAVIHSLLALSKLYYAGSDLSKALWYLDKAKPYIEKSSNLLIKAKFYFVLSSIMFDAGFPDRALFNLMKALRYYQQGNNYKYVVSVLSRMGSVFFSQNEKEAALRVMQIALKIAMNISEYNMAAIVARDIGIIYIRSGDIKKAGSYFSLSETLNEKEYDPYFSNYIDYNLGVYYIDHHSLDSAKAHLSAASESFKNSGNKPMQGLSLIETARCYLFTKDFNNCRIYLDSAYRIFEETGSNKLQTRCLEFRSQLQFAMGDIAGAYKTDEYRSNLSDSLKNIEIIQKTNGSQELLKEELAAIEVENELAVVKQKKTYLAIIFVIAIITLALLTYLITMKLRLKVKHEQLEKSQVMSEVEHKNKELARNVINSIKKNEVLRSMSEQLSQLSEIKDEAQREDMISKLSRDIRKHLNNETWKEFDTRFTEVHTDFYKNLMEKFPNLTPNEIKLCAFLRLNLTSKQISELTGQQISAIEIARIRLRKKLGIANAKINMIVFLSQI